MSQDRANCRCLAAYVLILNMPEFHMGATSYPGSCPTSHPALCLWPRKAVKKGPKPWDPAPMWETQMKLQAPGF